MKNLLLALNLVLIAAVGYLYFYNFSGKKNKTVVTNSNSSLKDSCGTRHRIAYVDLDSLNENLVYLKQQRKDLDVQQKQVEAKIAGDYKDLDQKKNSFLQGNPNAKPEDLQKFQMLYMQEQERIESERQKQSQVFNQKSFTIMEGIQKKLKEFLAEYNKEKKFQFILTTGAGIDYLIYKDSTLDITKDVIIGMNEKLKPAAN